MVLTLFPACHPYSGGIASVRYDGEEPPGTLTVVAAGTGSNGREAVEAACVNAVQALLYDGIPGSQYHLPLINRALHPQGQDDPYLASLRTISGCRPFLTHSERRLGPLRRSDAAGKYAEVRLTIHVAALRRELEHRQLIRMFGM